MGDTFIEVELMGVTLLGAANSPTVLLRAEDRILFISIGPFEAAAIGWGLEGEKPIRPMTHDLIINLLAGLNCTLKSVNIYALQQSTFFAYLLVEQKDASGQLTGVIRVDSRPSDSIALAVRAKCPIYVAQSVMEEAGQDLNAIRFGERPEAFDEEDESEEDNNPDTSDNP